MKYKPAIVIAYFAECGLPCPETEYRFHPERKWRFDFAWPNNTEGLSVRPKRVALEVDGGIWIRGGHNRGPQIKATWKKENEAQIAGWCIIKCEPKDVCTLATVDELRRALGLPEPAPALVGVEEEGND